MGVLNTFIYLRTQDVIYSSLLVGLSYSLIQIYIGLNYRPEMASGNTQSIVPGSDVTLS